MNNWSKSDIEKLKKLYPYVKNAVIAKVLNRSSISVDKKAFRLGLKKDSEVLSAMRSLDREGDKSSSWKGGRKITSKGYVLVLDKNNPDSAKSGYIMEHRKVMSEHLGRRLKKDEAVHHINGNKSDNRIENLELTNWSEHTIHHHTGSKRSAETRKKISTKAKQRLKNREDHPLYKEIDPSELIRQRQSGMTVKEICNHHGICGRTYYNKLGDDSNK